MCYFPLWYILTYFLSLSLSLSYSCVTYEYYLLFIITVGRARSCQTLVRQRRWQRRHPRPGFRKGAKLHSGKVERQEEVALLVLSVGEVRGAGSYYKV